MTTEEFFYNGFQHKDILSSIPLLDNYSKQYNPPKQKAMQYFKNKTTHKILSYPEFWMLKKDRADLEE